MPFHPLLLRGLMVSAVALVVALAYADLRREQARALADFTEEQTVLAETVGAAVGARLEHGSLADANIFSGLVSPAGPEAFQRVLAVAGDGKVVEMVAGRWPPLPGDGEGGTLLEEARAQRPITMTLSRPGADSLGVGQRMAVAAVAPVSGHPWSVLVVTSARRVRDRARIGTERLIATAIIASLLVLMFGGLASRQERRAIALAERLHLAEATAALRERSEKIVEAIPLGVLAVDGRRNVTSVNAFLSARGARAAPFAEALPIEASERAPLEALLDEAQKTRKPASARALKLHVSSEPREVDAYAIPLARPLADTDCFLLLDDRTELRQLERNLGRAEKLATIGTLAAGVAHEVGTPLGVISGRAEQLQARFPADEGAQKSVASILAQVDKVSTTIRQLLDFARVRPVEAAPVTPTTALETARALLEHRFRQAKVSLSVDAPPSVPAVVADAGQLEQVLVNLLMNACDACAAGGHVHAAASLVDGQIEFAVSDDGCGIAPEHLPSVLDPFFTTKKRGQGTGLGLTIAADIVKNHGGSLQIDSTVGRGTSVRVRLPRSQT